MIPDGYAAERSQCDRRVTADAAVQQPGRKPRHRGHNNAGVTPWGYYRAVPGATAPWRRSAAVARHSIRSGEDDAIRSIGVVPVAAVLFGVLVSPAGAQTVIVTPSNLQGWQSATYGPAPDYTSPYAGAFSGITTTFPDLGLGSTEIQLDDEGNSEADWYYDFGPTALSSRRRSRSTGTSRARRLRQRSQRLRLRWDSRTAPISFGKEPTTATPRRRPRTSGRRRTFSATTSGTPAAVPENAGTPWPTSRWHSSTPTVTAGKRW